MVLYNMIKHFLRKNPVIKVASDSCKFSEHRMVHTTVDFADVNRHSKLVDKWWNTDGPMQALHTLNLLRVPFVRDGLIDYSPNNRSYKPLKDKNILDVGCGGGILSEPLARLGAHVTGIDFSKELLDLAVDHASKNETLSENRPTYCRTSVEDHVIKYKNHYDGLTASEIIEHVDNKELFVKSCVNALKPGGKIFFTTLNRTRISQIAAIYLAENVFRVIPAGTHQYDKFITPTELTFLLERSNCHVEIIYGIMYNVFTKKWSWIDSQSVFYALQAVKLQ